MGMLNDAVGWVNGIVWGPLMLFFILGVGLFLTIGLKLLTIRRIPFGFSLLWKGRIPGDAEGQISPFNALMTSLSATIGTGNIAGVATAVALGGPGAIGLPHWLVWQQNMPKRSVLSDFAKPMKVVILSVGRCITSKMVWARTGDGWP